MTTETGELQERVAKSEIGSIATVYDVATILGIPLDVLAWAASHPDEIQRLVEGKADLVDLDPQRISRDRDIILQAINKFDSFMLDDDYDYQRTLYNIIRKMKERIGIPDPDGGFRYAFEPTSGDKEQGGG